MTNGETKANSNLQHDIISMRPIVQLYADGTLLEGVDNECKFNSITTLNNRPTNVCVCVCTIDART
jgi:hypothetical protein